MTIKSRSAYETQKLGISLAKKLSGGEIILLHGNLGAGKTTFVQGLAKGLGVKGRVTSPTFILVRKHEIPKESLIFWHIDLYRMADEEEITGLGLSDLWPDKKNVVVIEWPEKIEKVLPEKRIEIDFRVISETEREIEVRNLEIRN